MRDRLLAARSHFTTHVHFARFLGVQRSTLQSWLAGTTEPWPSVSRFLDVLDVLEAVAPELLVLLVKRYRPWRKPKRMKPPPRVKTSRAPKPTWQDAPMPQVYTRLAYDAGEYDHLIGAMEDDEWEAFKASLV